MSITAYIGVPGQGMTITPALNIIGAIIAAKMGTSGMLRLVVATSGHGSHYFGHANGAAEDAADDAMDAARLAARYKRHRRAVREAYERKAQAAFDKAQRYARIKVRA